MGLFLLLLLARHKRRWLELSYLSCRDILWRVLGLMRDLW